jgi:hypothetical protein
VSRKENSKQQVMGEGAVLAVAMVVPDSLTALVLISLLQNAAVA